MRIIVEGVNPEPWRPPQLGTRRAGKKIVPCAFKDENLRNYQMALFELVRDALGEQGLELPVYVKGTPLAVSFRFWRSSEGLGRNIRHHADVTNMVKAAEDALQGLVYHNDKQNVDVNGILMGFGPDVKPLISIEVEPAAPTDGQLPEWMRLLVKYRTAKSGCVWVHA